MLALTRNQKEMDAVERYPYKPEAVRSTVTPCSLSCGFRIDVKQRIYCVQVLRTC